MYPRRLSAPLTPSLALAVGMAACGGDDGGEPERPAPTATPTPASGPADLTGGITTLRMDATSVRVLELAGVELRPIGDAVGGDRRLRFPISGGELSLAHGRRVAYRGVVCLEQLLPCKR